MSKKTFQIMSLVISIISLIYLICNYLEINRYLYLYFNDTEKYISNYHTLPKNSKDKIVISFSISNETDLKKIKPFINSLLDQTTKVDDISMTIPSNLSHKVPDNIKNVVSVQHSDKYYEDASNLICSVLREPESNTKIILVEPMVYGKEFVENMISESEKNPDNIIFGNKNKDQKFGILIKPKFFDENICLYENGFGYKNWLNKCCKKNSTFLNFSPIYKLFY